MITGVQTAGVHLTPFNPLLVALVLGAGFVARCFSGEKEHLKETMKAAIRFPGYALVDILQPCVVFNKLNTFTWYRKRVRQIENHDPSDRLAALSLASRWDEQIPIGIFYSTPRPTFESHFSALGGVPLSELPFSPASLFSLQDEFI